MSVYGRNYKGYSGPTTSAWERFLVISRYSLQDVFRSRLFTGFFVLCFVWPLACAVLIYLHYNIEALTILDLSALDLIEIDTTFFLWGVLRPQTAISFVLIMIVGPALISPDLRNNAMPLYLSRPLNKSDYILGKLTVVLLLASAVTWVPGLFLFFLQSYLAGGSWFVDHLQIGIGVFFGSWVWIVVLSIFALAVSAWVKWKPLATMAFVGSIIVLSALGTVFKLLYDTWWGSIIVFDDLASRVFSQLFGVESSSELPVFVAWFFLAVFAGFSLFLLHRRIRAFEVIS